MDNFLSAEIANGVSVGEILSVQFLASILGSLLSAVLVLVIGWALAAWLGRRVRNLGHKERFDETLFNFLGAIVRYTILVFTFVFVLNRFGLQTTSVVAALGAAGLAIGLALQGTLSNVAAGVMLIFFRPIKTGDFVVVNGQMGTVKDISLNYTELASIANVQIIIPNSEVWGNTITNYSAYDVRRVEWTFGVGYGANLGTAEKVILDTIMADPRAHAEPEPFIKVTNLNDSSVDFLVRIWCANADAFAFQGDMTRAVKEALDAAGVEIPFPTRTLVHENSAVKDGLRVAGSGGDTAA
ncbi:mechanosensitive ion channel family protein [Roseicyclus sp. F158]|uniref:Small-conductance mechanosensitive channel n=1 Tax=Tropicimonas omnivorans TaxID=3075590 RepID=A0ABU3DES5_9RHOB|nr:mechanosensitive ion channel family protein [Roseicyclus sp. F158]MDT0682064.1 mechanosensitive ion channel family protein [Roseicyclus sp. F158]